MQPGDSGGDSGGDENTAPRPAAATAAMDSAAALPPAFPLGGAAGGGGAAAGRRGGGGAAEAGEAVDAEAPTDEEFALRLQQEEQRAHFLELAGYGAWDITENPKHFHSGRLFRSRRSGGAARTLLELAGYDERCFLLS